MDKQSIESVHPDTQDRDQFIHIVKSLLQIETAAKVLLSGNKKKVKQFNKKWLQSGEMVELNVIVKKVESLSTEDLTCNKLRQDMRRGIDLSHILIGKGEALINQLSGLATQAPTVLKKKKKR